MKSMKISLPARERGPSGEPSSGAALAHDPEDRVLAPWAARAARTRGRLRPEPDPEPDARPAFEQDVERIVHAKSFRRLAHKTQVFLAPEGDHYRTRITHTLEVARVAQQVSARLGLNEPLAEAIAMGHDLGHTPFGHAGETVLAHLMPGGFHHAKQSLRVVDVLENDGAGLNLTAEVRDGILKHSKGRGPIVSDNPRLTAMTLEGQVVRLSDIIAYVNHDLDDAIRAGLLREADLPPEVKRVLGESHAARARALVRAVVDATRPALGRGERRAVRMDEAALAALVELREFLYDRVYENPNIRDEFEKAKRILGELWEHYHAHADEFREKCWPKGVPESDGLGRAVGDFLSGMTDRYALRAYEELRLPRRWRIY
jgi:dGTPase